jgi:hypothetical protein
MIEYIQQHFKLFLVSAGLIVLVLVAVFFLVINKSSKPDPTDNFQNNGLIIDETNQFLLNSELTDQEKYLMLLAQNMVEDFGTYKPGDLRLLWDLQNQSTSNFSLKVQEIIDSTSKSKNIKTVVDPESIKISNATESSATATMNTVRTDNLTGTKSNQVSVVDFVKQGDFWLVDNIELLNR